MRAFAPRPAVPEAPSSGVRLRTRPAEVRVWPTPAPPRNGGALAPDKLCYGSTMAADPLQPLTHAALSGDARATRALLEKLAPAMLSVVHAVMGRDSAEVEDLLQESLVAVVGALPSFREESSILHFARTIALRRALNHRRARARHAGDVELASVAEDPVMIDEQASPMETSLAQRRREAVRALLEELRDDQAETFAQRVLFGYSAEEIAAAEGVPLGTVKSRLRLAKTALRARIERDPALLELLEMDDDDAR